MKIKNVLIIEVKTSIFTSWRKFMLILILNITNILCISSSIVCVARSTRKNMRKIEKKETKEKQMST
jgi:hypothetical protein